MACNWTAVEVFRRCKQATAGMSGVCVGFEAQEVQSALELRAVPRKRWRRISDDVFYMGAIAADTINGRTRSAPAASPSGPA